MIGMILLSELSRRRIRSISKLIKVGRQEPVMVLRVDKEKVGRNNFEIINSSRMERKEMKIDGIFQAFSNTFIVYIKT